MQAIYRIRKRIQSFTTTENIANVLIKPITSSIWAIITTFNNNFSLLPLSNFLQKSIIPMLQNSEIEVTRLIKKERCYNYIKRGNTIHNCLQKIKLFPISEIFDIEVIDGIDREKRSFF